MAKKLLGFNSKALLGIAIAYFVLPDPFIGPIDDIIVTLILKAIDSRRK